MALPLFRAKNISNGKFAEGQVHTYGDGVFITRTELFSNGGGWRVVAIEVEKDTIQQFTGYCDSFGVKIFEGDKLKHWVDSACQWEEWTVVKQEDGSFVLDDDANMRIFKVAVCAVFEKSEVID